MTMTRNSVFYNLRGYDIKQRYHVGLFIQAMIGIFKREKTVALIIDDKIVSFLELKNKNLIN